MKQLTTDTLAVARTQIGVREVNLSNTGPQVDRYIRRAGLRPPCSWCACFVYWCIDEAAIKGDVPNPFLRGGFCPYIDHWARHEGILHASPAPGDVFLLYSSRAHHTGLVVGVDGSMVETIEGNTNDNGSVNGDGVYRRHREVGPHLRFVRWEALVEEDTPAPWSLYLGERHLSGLLFANNRTYAPVEVWARALGLSAVWNFSHHAFKLGGKLLDTQLVTSGGVTMAPVRDLANLAGLKLDVDTKNRKLTAHR